MEHRCCDGYLLGHSAESFVRQVLDGKNLEAVTSTFIIAEMSKSILEVPVSIALFRQKFTMLAPTVEDGLMALKLRKLLDDTPTPTWNGVRGKKPSPFDLLYLASAINYGCEILVTEDGWLKALGDEAIARGLSKVKVTGISEASEMLGFLFASL